METLKIQIPKGFMVDSFNKDTGEISFKEKSKKVTERIKTIDDVLEDNGLTHQEIDEMFKNVPKHLKFQYIAELICKSLNEGWQPDWDDEDQYKYFPWFKMGSSAFRYGGYVDWSALSLVGSRLCLKSRELAIYAGEQFTDWFRKFMIIE